MLGAMLLSTDAVGVGFRDRARAERFLPAGEPAHLRRHPRRCTPRASRSIRSRSPTCCGAAVCSTTPVGPKPLHELQNATPAISSARHYAKIVQDTAILRRLIRAAGDIAELAYGGPDDVTKAVDQAESTVFHVAEDRVADTTRPIKDLIDQTMDRLEQAYERGTTITGAPTGYHDLDELLSGLQKSTLNIVGARPAMGKCVAWDTPIVDVATGAVVTAAELFDRAMDRSSLELFALGPDGRLGRATVSACVDDGTKPVFSCAHAERPRGDDHGEPPAAHRRRLAPPCRRSGRGGDCDATRATDLRHRRAARRRDRSTPPKPSLRVRPGTTELGPGRGRTDSLASSRVRALADHDRFSRRIGVPIRRVSSGSMRGALTSHSRNPQCRRRSTAVAARLLLGGLRSYSAGGTERRRDVVLDPLGSAPIPAPAYVAAASGSKAVSIIAVHPDEIGILGKLRQLLVTVRGVPRTREAVGRSTT